MEDEMISFKRLEIEDVPWEHLSGYKGANIFHTLPWITFIQFAKGAEPVVAAVQSDGQVQGYFMGFITQKYGLRILGSPWRGWATYFMGFTLKPDVSYHDVLLAFPKFAFHELKCHYLEITDINLRKVDLKGLPYRVEQLQWFSLDLTKSEEELFANMDNKSGRRTIKRAIRRGVVIEEATDPAFADEYYAQYQEVLARKNLVPTYSLEFVRQMISQLLPTGNLLLLRARNSEGVCIATDISVVFNKVAVGWGGASWKQYQILSPNELINWYAMKKLKSIGVEVLHMGGEAEEFKKKLGCYKAEIFRLMKPKNPFLNIPLKIASSLRNPRVRNWVLKALGR
jgi:hypothetical protein